MLIRCKGRAIIDAKGTNHPAYIKADRFQERRICHLKPRPLEPQAVMQSRFRAVTRATPQLTSVASKSGFIRADALAILVHERFP